MTKVYQEVNVFLRIYSLLSKNDKNAKNFIKNNNNNKKNVPIKKKLHR